MITVTWHDESAWLECDAPGCGHVFLGNEARKPALQMAAEITEHHVRSHSEWVTRCTGHTLPGGRVPPLVPVGQFLEDVQPGDFGKRGTSWTLDKARAMRFKDRGAAQQAWAAAGPAGAGLAVEHVPAFAAFNTIEGN